MSMKITYIVAIKVYYVNEKYSHDGYENYFNGGYA